MFAVDYTAVSEFSSNCSPWIGKLSKVQFSCVFVAHMDMNAVYLIKLPLCKQTHVAHILFGLQNKTKFCHAQQIVYNFESCSFDHGLIKTRIIFLGSIFISFFLVPILVWISQVFAWIVTYFINDHTNLYYELYTWPWTYLLVQFVILVFWWCRLYLCNKCAELVVISL